MKIRLIDYGGKCPARAHANDAGADVFSPRDELLLPGEVCRIPLGFGLMIPDGYAGYIFPRSGLSAKGIVCELPPIDSGYRGEVHAIVSNVGSRAYAIHTGERIGQLVIMPVLIPDFTFEEWKDVEQELLVRRGDKSKNQGNLIARFPYNQIADFVGLTVSWSPRC